MSIRIHTTEAKNVRAIAVHRSEFADVFIDGLGFETVSDMPQEAAVIIKDDGNMEAFVVLGSRNELIQMGERIPSQARTIPEHDPKTVDGKIRNLMERYPLQDPEANDQHFGDDLGSPGYCQRFRLRGSISPQAQGGQTSTRS